MNSQFIKDEFREYEINELYLNRYINFVIRCSERNIYEGVYEEHHILPKGKTYWPEYRDLKINPWNNSILTPREHFIAHLILAKVFISGKKRAYMVSTVLKMKRGKQMKINSKSYEIYSNEHRWNMTHDNPMKNPDVVAKMKINSKQFFSSEKGIEARKLMSANRKGVNNISPEGMKRLSDRWLGVSRPRTNEHQEKIREATSKGRFITPWGEFWSPQKASDHIMNTEKMSRFLIKNRCVKGVDGFSFIEKIDVTPETRGLWKRENKKTAV